MEPVTLLSMTADVVQYIASFLEIFGYLSFRSAHRRFAAVLPYVRPDTEAIPFTHSREEALKAERLGYIPKQYVSQILYREVVESRASILLVDYGRMNWRHMRAFLAAEIGAGRGLDVLPKIDVRKVYGQKKYIKLVAWHTAANNYILDAKLFPLCLESIDDTEIVLSVAVLCLPHKVNAYLTGPSRRCNAAARYIPKLFKNYPSLPPLEPLVELFAQNYYPFLEHFVVYKAVVAGDPLPPGTTLRNVLACRAIEHPMFTLRYLIDNETAAFYDDHRNSIFDSYPEIITYLEDRGRVCKTDVIMNKVRRGLPVDIVGAARDHCCLHWGTLTRLAAKRQRYDVLYQIVRAAEKDMVPWYLIGQISRMVDHGLLPPDWARNAQV